MNLASLSKLFPTWQNTLLALLAAGLLILAFPGFEWWWTAWFALMPLMWAVERQKSVVPSFMLGSLFGTAFFFGTCWWLTYAPIHYAAFPWPLAYFLILIVCLGAGIFPGIFAAIFATLLRRFGSRAFIAAPFVWVFTEFLRYWITGNNWNAVGYSQAFSTFSSLQFAHLGGVYASSLAVTALNGAVILAERSERKQRAIALATLFFLLVNLGSRLTLVVASSDDMSYTANIVAVQPNVPMSPLTSDKLADLRGRQVELAEQGVKITKVPDTPVANHRLINVGKPTLVVLPESPMNFMYADDREFQKFIGDFARRNNVSVLFNSAEPDTTNGKYFNSAVMVGPDGKEIAEYDKIYLLPFGEAVPPPFDGIMPGFVGTFSYGREYDLLPVGDAKAGVMICFESHFGALSREYVRNGADVLIEMTNDGYLGPTPVLRQHLANAVFRAVETNRPILRVTNVGITAYIDRFGEVLDPADTYAEATRVWTVSKSNGSQTFYVKYGDWFAWVCTIITLGMLGYAIFRRRQQAV